MSHLPLIRKHIIAYGNQIIQDSNSGIEEKESIDKIIKGIIDDMNNNNLTMTDEDVDLLKSSIEMLLTSQLPFSKMASKIRNLKGGWKNL